MLLAYSGINVPILIVHQLLYSKKKKTLGFDSSPTGAFVVVSAERESALFPIKHKWEQGDDALWDRNAEILHFKHFGGSSFYSVFILIWSWWKNKPKLKMLFFKFPSNLWPIKSELSRKTFVQQDIILVATEERLEQCIGITVKHSLQPMQ